MELRNDLSMIVVNAATLAELLDLTRPRITQLANEGVLKRTAQKRYPLDWNIAAYLRYLRGQSSDEDGEEKRTSEMYWEEKALHERAKRKTAELNLEKLMSRLHEGSDVELVMSAMLAGVRSKLLGLSSVLTPQVVGRSKEEVDYLIQSTIEETLEELKDYTPDLFSGSFGEEADDENEDR